MLISWHVAIWGFVVERAVLLHALHFLSLWNHVTCAVRAVASSVTTAGCSQRAHLPRGAPPAPARLLGCVAVSEDSRCMSAARHPTASSALPRACLFADAG